MTTVYHQKVGKLVRDSIALSFAKSARHNCDASCRLWTSCYASRLERIYKGLNRKLATHYRKGPQWVVNRAIAEIPDKPLRWGRLSVDGSLPNRGSMTAKQWGSFTRRLRTLISMGTERGAKWHIPVESLGKARSYRAALRGLGVVVRRSSQANSLLALLRSTDHRSWVVGRIHAGCVTKAEKHANSILAYATADRIRYAGQTCVVCPAIGRGTTQCGQCTACASDCVDVVLFPFHG